MSDTSIAGPEPERFRGAGVGLLNHVPRHAARALVVGRGRALEAGLIKRAGIAWVGYLPLETRAPALPPGVVDAAHADFSSVEAQAPYDLVIWLDPPSAPLALRAATAALAGLLAPNGQALAVMPLRESDSPGHCPTLEEAVAALADAGLPIYNFWTGPAGAPREAVDHLLMLVRPDYNPLALARDLADAGQPDAAFNVLEGIPPGYLEDDDAWVGVGVEKQLNLVQCMKRDGLCNEVGHFSQAAHLFHGILARHPTCHEAAQVQAELYRAVGAPALGARLLRNLLEVAPHPGATRQLAHLEAPPPPVPLDAPPPWRPGARPPRILFVMPTRMHYGLDVLYDGLCRLLGHGQVVDFPHKPSLHGGVEEAYKNYPCAFDYPGTASTLDAMVVELRAGAFDLVLWGDCEHALDLDLSRALAAAVGRTPAYLVDGLDQFLDVRPMVEGILGLHFRGYFKREMVIGMDYGHEAHPLPFAYPDHLFPDKTNTYRDIPLFWAGHRKSGLRRIFLEHLERHLGHTLEGNYPQSAYLEMIGRSEIGLCLFGYGFDTVRYWELPAHGAMLLAERLPLRIPHPFVDGETALHFDGVQELLTHFEALADDPARARAIAAAGHQHARRHHTGSARARQLLGWIQARGDLPQPG